MTSLNVFWAGPRNVAAYGSQNPALFISHTKMMVIRMLLFLYPTAVNQYAWQVDVTGRVHPSIRDDNGSVISRGCKFCYVATPFHMVKTSNDVLQLEMDLLA